VVRAPPERQPDQGNADHPTEEYPDERPGVTIKVGKHKYDEAEEDQQKAGRKQPYDGRRVSVFQRLIDILAADIHGFGFRSRE
jgi:hypothetical protein